MTVSFDPHTKPSLWKHVPYCRTCNSAKLSLEYLHTAGVRVEVLVENLCAFSQQLLKAEIAAANIANARAEHTALPKKAINSKAPQMAVRIVKDYRFAASPEPSYFRGMTVSFDSTVAECLIDLGYAEPM